MSFFGSLFGTDSAKASNAAAADQYAKQTAAAQGLTNAGATYNTQIQGLAPSYDPYVSGGNDALSRLMAGLGLGGDSQGFINAYRALPGYQAGLDRGSAAITGNAAARGLLKSGSTAKALTRFGQDYEDQKSGDYLNRLYALSGMGYNATGAQDALRAQGYGGQYGAAQGAAGIYNAAAPTIGQGMVAGAQAKQSALTNLMNTGAKLAGAALGGGFGDLTGTGASSVGSYFSPSGSNPFNPDGSRNVLAYGFG